MRNIVSNLFLVAGALAGAYSVTERTMAAGGTCAGGYFFEYESETHPPNADPDWFMSCNGSCAATPPICTQRFKFWEPASTDIFTWCGCSNSDWGDPPESSAGGCSLRVTIHTDPVTGDYFYDSICYKTDCSGTCTAAPGQTSHGYTSTCDCD